MKQLVRRALSANLPAPTGSAMRMLPSLPGLLLLLALPAMPAAAHHSPAQFDLSQDLTLDGVLSEVSWRNPHIYLELEITEPDGQTRTQRIEAGPASNLSPLGFDAASLRAGEPVSIQVKPNRGGADRTVLGWVLTKADGSVVPLHVRAIPPTTPGSAVASSIEGTWVPQGTGFSALAVAARSWPLTDAGRAAVEATREARDASRSACIPFGPPALMALPSTIIVSRNDNTIRMRLDVMDAERLIHLDPAARTGMPEPSLGGYSTGHFDGDTLVVETDAYLAHADGYAFDLPSSASKRIVERFTLSADRRHLDYEAVIEDPAYLAETVVHRSQWDYRPLQQPSRLPCDADVAGRFTEDE